jgi:hypothetical protein
MDCGNRSHCPLCLPRRRFIQPTSYADGVALPEATTCPTTQ